MRSNWLYALMAFLMSVTLWYMVTGRERVETLVEVKLEFKGIPSGLVVREGLTNKISVRIRGPRGRRTQLGAELRFGMLLSGAIEPIAGGTRILVGAGGLDGLQYILGGGDIA